MVTKTFYTFLGMLGFIVVIFFFFFAVLGVPGVELKQALSMSWIGAIVTSVVGLFLIR